MASFGLNRRGLIGLTMFVVGLGLLAGAQALYARRTAPLAAPTTEQTQPNDFEELTRALQGGRGEIEPLANRLIERDGQKAIPLLIGMIDADNSYDTVYWIGHFQLAKLTGVGYSPIHDGAWWRRWWEQHRQEYPADVQAIAIPDLPKTEHGKRYQPLPPETDTLAGLLDLAVKLLAQLDMTAEQRKKREGIWIDVSDIARDLERFDDPRAIPTIIGIIDADNSYHTVGFLSGPLAKLTGVAFSHVHDGAWWRRWWAEHQNEFSADAQAIPIPDLPKTAHGKSYQPLPPGSDTLSGLLDLAVKLLAQLDMTPEQREKEGIWIDIGDIATDLARFDDPRAIPTIIGIIDADNSYETVYFLGYFALRPLTDVAYSPIHDGAWWRRWWDAHRHEYSAEAQAISIPDLPKTAHGKLYQPLPPETDTLAGMLDLAVELLGQKDLPPAQRSQDKWFHLSNITSDIAQYDDSHAIPTLIGIIDADNSYDTVYFVGAFGLGPLTGVSYSKFHDGAWWRRWWEKHRHDYPADVQAIPVPDLPKTASGREYQPFPADSDTLQGKLRMAAKLANEAAALVADRPSGVAYTVYSDLAQEIAKHLDPHAIPYLIGLMASDKTGGGAIYGVGYWGLCFGRNPLTGEEYDQSHDAAWWCAWWEKNKARYPADVQAIEIPDYSQPLVFNWTEEAAEDATP